MDLSWADLEKRVRKLTTKYRDTGDRIYSVECVCGTLLGVTKVGRHRGAKKRVGYTVLGMIPRQLKIEPALWRDIADCTKGRNEYIAARDHAGCLRKSA